MCTDTQISECMETATESQTQKRRVSECNPSLSELTSPRSGWRCVAASCFGSQKQYRVWKESVTKEGPQFTRNSAVL